MNWSGMNWSGLADATQAIGTASKDWKRIQLFARACESKERELVATCTVAELVDFNADAVDLVARWLNVGVKVASNPIRYLFTDPFKGLRQDTREFASRWRLSDEFVKAMG